jgi:hypothetical protein
MRLEFLAEMDGGGGRRETLVEEWIQEDRVRKSGLERDTRATRLISRVVRCRDPDTSGWSSLLRGSYWINYGYNISSISPLVASSVAVEP